MPRPPFEKTAPQTARVAAVEEAMALAREREDKGLAIGSDPAAIPEFKDADKAYSRARAEYLFATRALGGAIARYAAEDTGRLIAARRDQLVSEGVEPDIAEREAAGSVESDYSSAVVDSIELSVANAVGVQPSAVTACTLRMTASNNVLIELLNE